LTIVWTNNINVKLGESSAEGNYRILANPKRVIPKWVDGNGQEIKGPEAIHALNSTNPKGYNQPHKSVVFEIHCSGREWNAFHANGSSSNKEYIVPTGPNPTIPYFVVTYVDSAGVTWTATFTGVVMGAEQGEFVVDDEVVTVYIGSAYYYIETHN
jgi:hypothetical protein